MPDHRRDSKPVRRYPRALRVNELLREVLAEELALLLENDERLGLLTITAVDCEADLRHAKVFLSSLPESAEEALGEHRARLQAAIGRQARLRRTPQLSFEVDPGVRQGAIVDDILRGLNDGEQR
ncbi:MAG TPA: 30S ribosome-binding factor RbfA [Acidimicrobiales bacterium]|jgi:ribosome-binding factor A|nr:30S ribosome-binding factor RbfA [Acidimicrobiales bacterium]